MLRQLLYISSKVPRQEVSIGNVLMVSQRNNSAVNVSGLLYTDGTRFLQVLEGDGTTVGTTFERIRADPRHHAIVVLSDREVDVPEFGAWSMAYRRPTDPADAFDDRLNRLLDKASPAVRGTFMGLVATRRVA